MELSLLHIAFSITLLLLFLSVGIATYVVVNLSSKVQTNLEEQAVPFGFFTRLVYVPLKLKDSERDKREAICSKLSFARFAGFIGVYATFSTLAFCWIMAFTFIEKGEKPTFLFQIWPIYFLCFGLYVPYIISRFKEKV